MGLAARLVEAPSERSPLDHPRGRAWNAAGPSRETLCDDATQDLAPVEVIPRPSEA